jgi:formylglycine-generating enzyme required for sulfatase activity/serine/threonine protein kinase
MNTPTKPHPTGRTLRSFGLGKLDAARGESVQKHLENCPDCCRHVAELTNDTFLDRLRNLKVRLPSLLPMMSSLTRRSRQATDPGYATRPPDNTFPPALAGRSSVAFRAAKGAEPDNAFPPALAGHPDYEVIRELGRGGMGVVYLVHNRLMRRKEVLKVVASHRIDRRGALDRFLTEIGNAGRLHHPNIVTAYSALHLGENLALAMEYVEGLDLSRMVKARGPLSVAQACNYIYQAALGLEHAHERGMVHRDIKPSNLMLTRDGNRALVKVLDFGLAKVKSENMVEKGLTHDGQMLGTPGYIAPEQIGNARHADIRADVYSLGCTLYYLLTGSPPFQADSLYDLLQAHESMDALPLDLARSDVPVAVAAIGAKMLAKEPARRFHTPGEVARALKPFFKSGSAQIGTLAAEVSRAPAPRMQAESTVTWPPGPPGLSNAETRSPVASIAGKPAMQSAASRSCGTLADVIEKASVDALAPTAAQRTLGESAWRWTAAAGTVVLAGLLGTWAAGVFKTLEASGKESQSGVTEPAPLIKIEPRPTDVTPLVRRAKLIRNTIGMELALIPADTFMMGSTPGQIEKLAASFPQLKFKKEQAAREQPQHPVRISRSFYLGEYEVTRGQFAEFVRANSYATESERDGKGCRGVNLKTKTYELSPKYSWRNTGFAQNDTHPVVNVTWNDAVAFCEWLSRKEGKTYRLPTEAEWEYACRAGSATLYSTGDDATELVAAANLAGRADGFGFTAPVGSFEPNGFGLFDMHGNVAEWCADWFGEHYYASAPAVDPRGPSRGSQRVTRGQGWQSAGPKVRSAHRDPWDPSARGMSVGFRVVLEMGTESRDLAGNAADSLPVANSGRAIRVTPDSAVKDPQAARG